MPRLLKDWQIILKFLLSKKNFLKHKSLFFIYSSKIYTYIDYNGIIFVINKANYVDDEHFSGN